MCCREGRERSCRRVGWRVTSGNGSEFVAPFTFRAHTPSLTDPESLPRGKLSLTLLSIFLYRLTIWDARVDPAIPAISASGSMSAGELQFPFLWSDRKVGSVAMAFVLACDDWGESGVGACVPSAVLRLPG